MAVAQIVAGSLGLGWVDTVTLVGDNRPSCGPDSVVLEQVGGDAANATAPKSGRFSVIGPPCGGPTSVGLPVSHGS